MRGNKERKGPLRDCELYWATRSVQLAVTVAPPIPFTTRPLIHKKFKLTLPNPFMRVKKERKGPLRDCELYWATRSVQLAVTVAPPIPFTTRPLIHKELKSTLPNPFIRVKKERKGPLLG